MGAPSSRRAGSGRTGSGAEVMAHERAYDAHQLRIAGLSWPEIADRVGYLDGRVAAMAVNAYLQKIALEQAPDQRRRALDLELARLDQIQAAYFRAAIAGDIAAANLVLKVIARRCVILGFDKLDEDLASTPRAVVIGSSPEEYIAGLKAVIDGTHPGLVDR